MESRDTEFVVVKILSLLTLALFLAVSDTEGATTCGQQQQQQKERFLMLVSTLDGRMTALEVGSGKQEWSVETGGKPLLSSSISQIEMSKDGSPVRLIPSLDGALYQYDGSGIEPVPLAANLLLSNSFRFSDDSTVVGGESVETYGVDMKTGLLKYVCTMDGCHAITANSSEEADEEEVKTAEDTLVITRRTKTVRTVHMRDGHEKWNFSVGQHEVSFVKAAQAADQHHRQERIDMEGNMDAHCSVDTEEEGFFDGFDFRWFTPEEDGTRYSADDLKVKVIVPSGLVIAVLKDNPSQVVWQQRFDVAIANAWLLKGEDLVEVNLFDNNNVPALSMGDGTIPGEEGDEEDTSALLYVGVYDSQVYVQPSQRLMQEVHDATTRAIVTGETRAITMPRVHWKPYLATAVSRTPIVNPSHPNQKRIEYKQNSDDDEDTATTQGEGASNGNSKLSQYPFDEGVYLLQDYTPLVLGEDRQITDGSDGRHGNRHRRDDMDGHTYLPHLLTWWRELFAISLLTVLVSVIVHIVLQKFISKPAEKSEKSSTSETNKVETASVSSQQDSSSTPKDVSTEQTEYISRFYTDFEQTAVLGRGGFGVVFASRNQLDDCQYAIKRIALNKSDRARQKVMREVKALAKLDHAGIVRYYQSWFENPPAGWQECKDKLMVDMPSSTPGFSVTELSPTPKEVSPPITSIGAPEVGVVKRLSQLYLGSPDSRLNLNAMNNPLRALGGNHLDWDDNPEEEDAQSWAESSDTESSGLGIKPCGSSDTFVPHGVNFEFSSGSEMTGENDSKQFSKGVVFSNDEETFDVVFEPDSTGGGKKLPFSAYKIDSSSSGEVVFEDSGCGEHNNHTEERVPHSVITISSSSLNSRTSRSLSPLQTTDQSHQRHKKSASEDLTSTTRATRPSDLPLRKEKDDKPVAKLYLYIQMQLCKPETLKDWLLTSGQTRDRLLCLDIFHQIVAAMDYVHDMGLMHRDLKPSNIFFSMDGIVKIGDFGLVTALEETADTPYEGGPVGGPGGQRHTGQVGTKLYMSPEQMAGHNYTHKVDIYALGLIFFELFNSFDTEMERIRTMMDAKRLRFPESFTKFLSREEIVFVKRLLSHDPAHRPSTSQILAQSMFTPFEEVHKAYMSARARSSSRIRTYSTSSTSGTPSQSINRGSGSENRGSESWTRGSGSESRVSELNSLSDSKDYGSDVNVSGSHHRASSGSSPGRSSNKSIARNRLDMRSSSSTNSSGANSNKSKPNDMRVSVGSESHSGVHWSDEQSNEDSFEIAFVSDSEDDECAFN